MSSHEHNFEEGLRALKEGRASLKEIRALAVALTGHRFEPAIPALVQLLDHRDPIVRHSAASALGFEQRHKPAREKLLIMLRADSDDDCRRVAAAALGSLFQSTKDREIMAALSTAALHDSDEYVRTSAYEALLITNGLSQEEHLRLLTGREVPVDSARIKMILKDVSE